ncbi:MAG: PH domain-containing protein [Haloarculaceae archaeon]
MSGDAPDWVTLTEGEAVVWTGHPSLVTESGSIVFGAVLAAVGVAVAVGVAPVADLPVSLGLVGGGVALLGLLLVVAAYVRTRVTTYVLTTEEAYEKHGLFSRTVTNVRLERVQNTGFGQSFGERLVGVGSVHLDTAGTGGTEFVLASIREPDRVNGLVTEQFDRLARRRETGER